MNGLKSWTTSPRVGTRLRGDEPLKTYSQEYELVSSSGPGHGALSLGQRENSPRPTLRPDVRLSVVFGLREALLLLVGQSRRQEKMNHTG
jgi:hypothetical protein